MTHLSDFGDAIDFYTIRETEKAVLIGFIVKLRPPSGKSCGILNLGTKHIESWIPKSALFGDLVKTWFEDKIPDLSGTLSPKEYDEFMDSYRKIDQQRFSHLYN